MKRLILALSLLLLPFQAQAASTAEQIQPGYLTTSGCSGGQSSCFKPYTSVNPMPVSVTGGVLPSGNTGQLLGYTATGTTAAAITVGSGLALTGSTLSATGTGGGTVTSVAFAGDGLVLTATPSSPVTTSGTVTATAKPQTANTVLGATGTTLSALAVPSCSASTSALLWTSGTGFSCGTVVPPAGTGATGTWGISISGTAANVTTNANLTGDVTSVGNVTTLANSATGRANLGLGSIATQNANAVAITGGTLTGITATGTFNGNATTATALATTRAFSIAGSTGLTASGVNFDGTAAVALSLTGTLAKANGGSGSTLGEIIGTATGAVNPLVGTDVTTSLYSTTATSISVAIAGVDALDVTSSGVNAIGASGFMLGGANAIRYPANDTTTGASVAIGTSALANQTATAAAYHNTAVGYQAIGVGTMTNIAIDNTAVGYQVLKATTSGTQNTGIGSLSLAALTTGKRNTAIGYTALQSTATGLDNTGLGYRTLVNSTGASNTAAGSAAGSKISTGSGNLALGLNVASTTLTTGSNNILIGFSSAVDTPSSSSSNEINIGGIIFGNTNSTAAPAVSSCGTSPTIDSHANNKSGTVTVGSGVIATCTVTFAGTGYSTWNHCRVTPQTASLAAFAYSYTLTVLTVTGTSLTSSVFDYDCDGY